MKFPKLNYNYSFNFVEVHLRKKTEVLGFPVHWTQKEDVIGILNHKRFLCALKYLAYELEGLVETLFWACETYKIIKDFFMRSNS